MTTSLSRGRVMAEAWRWPEHISDTARAQAPELEELTFVIPQVPPSLNALLRMHWKERRKLSLQWAKLIWAARAEQVRGLFPRFEKASVTIERQSPHILDLDNTYGGTGKIICDALKANGIITDDAPDCITLTVKQARGPAQTTIHVRREA